MKILSRKEGGCSETRSRYKRGAGSTRNYEREQAHGDVVWGVDVISGSELKCSGNGPCERACRDGVWEGRTRLD